MNEPTENMGGSYRTENHVLQCNGDDLGGLNGQGANHQCSGLQRDKMAEVIRNEESVQPLGTAPLKLPVYLILMFTFKAVERLDWGQERAIRSV